MRKVSLLLPLIAGLAVAGCGSASDSLEATAPAQEVSIGALSPSRVGPAEVKNTSSLAEMAVDIVDCSDVASRTDIPLIHVPVLASRNFQVVCFLEMVDPERPEHLPEAERVPGIVYAPPDMSIKTDSFEDVVNRGGLSTTVRRPDPYDSLPSESDPDSGAGGHALVTINDAEGVVYRVVPERVSAIWYPTIDGQRLRVHAAGGYSPDEFVSILRQAEPGPPPTK